MKDPVHLLLVDNNPAYRDSLYGSLESRGYIVTAANTPDEAMQKLETQEFDLVLTELRLLDSDDPADRSGLQIARSASARGIPCILVTTFPSVELAHTVLRSQGKGPLVSDLIEKSSGPQAVLESIHRVLRDRDVQSERPQTPSLSIDLNKRVVRKNGETISVSNKQYQLLAELQRKAGGVSTFAELYKALYGNEIEERAAQNDKRLRSLVDRTKSKVESHGSQHEHIEVIPDRGIRLRPALAEFLPKDGVQYGNTMDVPKNTPGAEMHEDVHFTALHSREGRVEAWHTLLVYVHVASALKEVSADARHFIDEIQEPKEISAPSSSRLKRGTTITIVPSCEGITFNPAQISLQWLEDFHRAAFRFRADASLANDAAKGQISFYVGPLIVGTLKFAMLFSDTTEGPVQKHEEQAPMYRQDKIFISYSHNDTEIVSAFKKVHEATGYDVLIDVDDLRSGQEWNSELIRMIDRADIFQLFWSENSRKSKYCQQEWKHALTRAEEGFIRPVYWRKPIPDPPEELSKYHFEYVELKE